MIGRRCCRHVAARFHQGLILMDKRLLDILVCPVTKGKLIKRGDELWSCQAALAYPIRDDIPVMLEQEARHLALEEVEALKNERI